MANILIIEDEAIVAMENKMNLSNSGHHIIGIISSAEEAIVAFNEMHPDLVLMDIKLKGDLDGIYVVNEIRKYSNVPVVFLTGNSDLRTRQRIENISNSTFLFKPTLTNEIVSIVNNMLAKQ